MLGAFGGLVGYLNSGTVSQSYATGNASTVRFQVGGLVGSTGSNGVIINPMPPATSREQAEARSLAATAARSATAMPQAPFREIRA
ncbi:hypothetical protein V6L77_00160 [Pannonibacter sp. Pt2-lr]